jgi:uridine kinase
MVDSRPVIAISGGTCAGKSSLSERLSSEFSGRIAMISQDDFYPDRSLVPEADLAAVRWDSLSSIDVPELLNCLAEVIRDGHTFIPVYNKESHARAVGTATELYGEVVLLEGLHAIAVTRLLGESNKEFNAMRWLRIFLDCPEDKRFRRRQERESRGATVQGDFRLYWRDICEPIYLSEVYPQIRAADKILRHPYDEAEIEYIVNWISGVLAFR